MYADGFRRVHGISALDTMFSARDAHHYLEVGRSAGSCIAACLDVAGVGSGEVRAVLDFGCGYGRVLRALRRQFPHAALTASDVDRGGVDFCARTFGATGVYSSTDPSELSFDQRFDLIWVGSVFTHLDMPRWDGFLRALGGALTQSGVLVFTTHGPECEERLRSGDLDYSLERAEIERLLGEYSASGFGFGGYAPSDRHDYPDSGAYGVSVVDRNVARSLIEQAGLTYVHTIPIGWDDHQDVFAARLPT